MKAMLMVSLTSRQTIRLLFLSFPRFHTNPSDLQYFIFRLSIPGPEGLFHSCQHGVQGVRFPLPDETNLKQIADILLRKHQKGICQVETNPIRIAAQREEKSV